ncbi:MAG: hypothetical protein QOK59_03765 [Nitrososphaeraceae archaeon]|nr:hypothetical protein [Nitrososphaeraceae archaeon]MDW0137660.1 hypothetical protein [Nitrososphaeraceae archaeon]MDW0139616.1 hypothetical protein [Nitrososphaeraceae archaeon]MDW0144289.1 hypothetical protein [Nitrososphaeraceae archaeon]MDW0147785.1 hypothetical protein [Nitrososphaeraceae archaeon]
MIILYWEFYGCEDLIALGMIGKRKLVIGAFILSNLIIFLPNINGSFALQFTDYTSEKYQIQFQYPSDWLIKEKANRSDEGAEIDISNKKIAAGKLRIHFYDDLLESFGTTNLDAAFTKFYSATTTDDNEYEFKIIESPSFGSVDSQRTGSFLMTFKQKNEIDPITGAVKYWITFAGNSGYKIEFMATPENFDTPDNIEIRDQFIESIIFLGQNNATNTSGLSQVLLELQNN